MTDLDKDLVEMLDKDPEAFFDLYLKVLANKSNTRDRRLMLTFGLKALGIIEEKEPNET